ncbi:ketoacyl-synt-domain-containing protein [Aspergillus foveolatus]|uniref:ketoacyl-synt-domain-containing protein n=1 Tax=Aspergillus foveolatus TaxID=210207 RepID=UPI003CCC9707
MSSHFKLYLFGDQTFRPRTHFRALLANRDNAVLDDFLTKAYSRIRSELFRLPKQDRDHFPRFTCLEDLVFWQPGEDERRCVPLEMALLCLYQLGEFIRQADQVDLAAHKICVTGLCTGALAAAAVSCSRSILDLVPLGLDAIVAAFRTGLLVTDFAYRLASPLDGGQSWSVFVQNPTAVSAIDEFCAETRLIVKPYVSVYAPNGITVSGPPGVLRMLVQSSYFKDLRHEFIPVHGPYHTSDLYTKQDVEDVVGNIFEESSIRMSPSHHPLLSTAGVNVEGNDFAAVMAAAVREVLIEPIRWDEILRALRARIHQAGPQTFSVVPIGSTADQLIYAALQRTSFVELAPRFPGQAQSPTTVTKEGNGVISTKPAKPKLAIIGMAGRFPGAKDIEAFWDLLYRGLDVHMPVPALRWDIRTHVDPTGRRKNTGATPFGCWLDDPAGFDAPFFSISPREAPQIDPAQRLALMTAYEAIEQAGIVSDATPSTRRDRVGVFYGVTSNDWMETNSAQDIDTYFIPGGNRAFIPGRINYCFKFSGPSYAIDTACSSSLAGIHLACNALWQGDIDTAIAGGTNVLTNPDFTAGLDRGHFLSRTGNCKTFDDEADGYCRGEGIGTVIIKRLEDALADSDPILGVISGAYTNHSAESTSITRPHSDAQRAVFNRILNQAAVDPYSISYVEMHGTGTQAGDAGEMASVLDVFAPRWTKTRRCRSSHEALYLGSAKANIGHGEAASGVSSLIKVLLMMQKDTIVPHCGIKTKINRKFPTDLCDRNVHIALQPTAWPRTDSLQPRRAFVNNFSAAGGNTALMIEDPPAQTQPSKGTTDDTRAIHIIAVSAKVGISLQGNLQSLLGYLRQNPDVCLGQLSYTTTARRMHHPHRAALTGKSVGEICTQIETALSDGMGMKRSKNRPKVVFTFTGQGAQYPGMGREYFEYFSVFRTEICRLDQIGQSLGFPSVLPVMQSAERDIGLFSTTAVQLASVYMQVALCKLWASWNITPTAVLGHSLGEYAALHIAGVLSEVETIYLVGKRAVLLQEKCARATHSMLVVRGSASEIETFLSGETYEVSCINSPVETVLSGPREHISMLKELLAKSGLKSTLLHVPYAFHSSQVDCILSEFSMATSSVTFCRPIIPIVRPLDGQIIDDDGSFDAKYLVAHTREPVNMLRALQTAHSQNVITDQTIVVEIGPHPAVSSMVKSVLGSRVETLPSAQRAQSIWQVLTAALSSLYRAGAMIDWTGYHRDFPATHKVLPLPAYSWHLKNYWMQYVHDWSLRKGEPALTDAGTGTTLESTTIHRVIEETHHSQDVRIVVEADIARRDLSPLVQGHEVDGIPLCTPSVYADIALTIGTYVLQRYCPLQAEESVVDVSDMTITKALILRADMPQQLLQAHAEFDWASQSTTIKFLSFDTKQKLQEHSRCVVRFPPKGLQESLQASGDNIKKQMEVLRNGIALGTTARFNRPMIYRMIRPLARFHDDYRTIDEIVLNSTTLEASSRLAFGTVKRDGKFHTHPALIDSLTQSCGFAMNCNDSADLDVEVFMNHGWGSFQIFEPIDFDKVYSTYTNMKSGADGIWHGDVVVFDGDRVVAFFGKLAIQGVPRRVLKVILSMESGTKTHNQQRFHAGGRPPVTSLTTQAHTLGVSMAAKALSIIAEASGLELSDLTDSTVFVDAGIDSLLGLVISASLKEELGVDLDFHAFSTEFPTVADLKSFLSSSSTLSPTDTERTGRTDTSSEAGVATPVSVSVGCPMDFQRVLEIISQESGVAVEELNDETNFADCGVDSLLSLVIASRLQDEIGLAVPHDSLFIDCPTVLHLRGLLFGGKVGPPPMAADLDPHKKSQLRDGLLVARKAAVDALVQKYTLGFSVPPPNPSSSSSHSTLSQPPDQVVLVTGASGSLGAHLVYHLAHIPSVKTVVCVNREKRVEPYARQQKAMRDKGIHFPETLKSKLCVLQTDTRKPLLGLPRSEYEKLVRSVTHVIHNAWPMSVKRPLSAFEPQFQVLRNLLDFAADIVGARLHSPSFKLCFQLISSIGVVGHYDQSSHGQTEQQQKAVYVPEISVDIDSVLPNGYSEAKWGCERLIQATLQQHPSRFRAMIVRLGQIAGSRTSGYWNPMEHFGFLVKSSQTLEALPDVPGTAFWTPVQDIAATLSDLLGLTSGPDHEPYPIYHIDNPVGQPWKELNAVLSDALGINQLVPFRTWMDRVRAAPTRDNPATTLLEFLESNYLRMSCGGLILDVKRAVEHSKTLSAVGPIGEEVVRKYIQVWKEIGFLS